VTVVRQNLKENAEAWTLTGSTIISFMCARTVMQKDLRRNEEQRRELSGS
jgi:hypothetical protein